MARAHDNNQRPASGEAEQELFPLDPVALEAVVDFCESLRVERNLSEHTRTAYRKDLENYLRWASREGIDPLGVTHRQLRLYLGDLDRAQSSRATMNRRLSSLKGFFSWMTSCGRISKDPASVLQGAKQSRHLPSVLKPAEMKRLLSIHAAVDEFGNAREQSLSDMRDQALLELLYACGARVSEASGLLLANVDFRSRQVKVFGKGSKERIIPLHDTALSALRIYLECARPQLLKGKQSEFFFVSTRGNQMSSDAIRRMFKATVRAAGIDERMSPHDMRHTFATDLLDGGADLRSVQEMLGHASLSTTQIYTHLTASRLKSIHSQAHPRA